MKSALELAMEKANEAVGGAEGIKLTDEQKEAIDQVRKQYEAKWAEQEIALTGQLEQATGADPQALVEARRQVQEQMSKVRNELFAERDAKIEAIRNQ
ncbi:MAG: hypothetical protein F4Y91_16615 [Gemmatimonadetes bacterium]|nr:hypothetical protein [Gemmatimonadota bacterium]MXY83628.1 hypothetical protein [Gemmatimonadota bacterium]MYA23301.1 hypothetical protein [Gemmatimonadota bacterium]MYB70430.1 hypothetical protein [Gemmatimonadota bacterium]